MITQADIDAGPHAGITSPEDYGTAPVVQPSIDHRIAAIAADRDYWREQARATTPAPVAQPGWCLGCDPSNCEGCGPTPTLVAPTIHVNFETVDQTVIGSTSAVVKRVEVNGDGSFTAVIDHWPPRPGGAE